MAKTKNIFGFNSLCAFAYRDVGKGREQERKLCVSA